MDPPYEIYSISESEYYFLTTEHYTYLINVNQLNSFEDFPEISEYLFDINFDYTSEKLPTFKKNYDPRISITLVHFIRSYLKKYPLRILLYVCELTNNYHRHRKITFSSWYKKFRGNYLYEKMDNELKDEDMIYYISILFRKDHYFRGIIKTAFEWNIQYLRSNKD